MVLYIHTPCACGNAMSDTPVKILGLAGSYGLDSKNGLLLSTAMDYCQKHGAEVHIWDHVEKPLPLVGAEGCWEDKNVKELQTLVTECDGYILSSPEYHGTMSGVMKNTLDWIYKDHVGGKSFGLMSTLGGISNSNTLNHMRIAVRWIHGWCVPEQVAVGKVKEAFDDDNKLVDLVLQERVEQLSASVVKAARMLKEE